MMVFRGNRRPRLRLKNLRITHLRLLTRPGPECFQDHLMGVGRDESLHPLAFRPVEPAEMHQSPGHILETMDLQQCLGPFQMILAHLTEGRIHLFKLLIEMQGPRGKQ